MQFFVDQFVPNTATTFLDVVGTVYLIFAINTNICWIVWTFWVFSIFLIQLYFNDCHLDGIVSSQKLFSGNAGYREISMQYHLEAGHLCYFYYEAALAKEHFSVAEKLSGLSVQLKGIACVKLFKFGVIQFVVLTEREKSRYTLLFYSAASKQDHLLFYRSHTVSAFCSYCSQIELCEANVK